MAATVRIFITGISMLICATTSYAQDKEKWFDFWLGSWQVTWTDNDGKQGKGTNTISRILDDAVIQENFRADEGALKGYRGTSLSVYNPKTGTWHQGYADIEGAYFNFIGERDGEKRIFRTELEEKGNEKIIQRMVFYDITADSLKWDWESTRDGGKTWKLNWRINYKRM